MKFIGPRLPPFRIFPASLGMARGGTNRVEGDDRDKRARAAHVICHVHRAISRFSQPVKALSLTITTMSAKFAVSSALKEVRFHLSQTGSASLPLRNFLVKNYPSLKASNASLPVLVRESFGVKPSITARFEKGREVKNSLDGLDEKSIEETVKTLLK